MPDDEPDRFDFCDVATRVGMPGFTNRAESELADAASKIAELDTQLAALQNRRNYQLQRTGAFRYALAPIGKLSLDVLSEIFVDIVADSEMLGDKWDAAFRLVAACSCWRRLGLATPAMWRMALPISFRAPFELAFFQDLLSRSAPYAISLHLNHGMCQHPRRAARALNNSSVTQAALLDLIVQRNDRWSRIRCQVDVRGAFARYVQEAFPNLREIEWNSSRSSKPTRMLQGAPQLRIVELTTQDLSRTVLPWAQLRTLKLNYETHGSGTQIFETLAQCTGLYHLKIAFPGFTTESLAIPRTAITLRDVTTFGFTEHYTHRRIESTREYGPFFDFLELPSLRKAEFTFGYSFTSRPALSILPLLSRAPLLRSLHLKQLCGDLDSWRGILRNVPSITCLSIVGSSGFFDEQILRELTDTANPGDGTTVPPPLLPRLQELDISGASVPMRAPEEVLLRMILSRWWTDIDSDGNLKAARRVARWTSVNINVACRQPLLFSAEFVAKVEELCAQGLEISVVVRDNE